MPKTSSDGSPSTRGPDASLFLWHNKNALVPTGGARARKAYAEVRTLPRGAWRGRNDGEQPSPATGIGQAPASAFLPPPLFSFLLYMDKFLEILDQAIGNAWYLLKMLPFVLLIAAGMAIFVMGVWSAIFS